MRRWGSFKVCVEVGGGGQVSVDFVACVFELRPCNKWQENEAHLQLPCGCGNSRLSLRNINNFGEVLAIVSNQLYVKGGLFIES